jgi:hypothetical protein
MTSKISAVTSSVQWDGGATDYVFPAEIEVIEREEAHA